MPPWILECPLADNVLVSFVSGLSFLEQLPLSLPKHRQSVRDVLPSNGLSAVSNFPVCHEGSAL